MECVCTCELIYIIIRSDWSTGLPTLAQNWHFYNHLASIKYNLQKRSCGTKPNRKVLVSFSQEIQVSHLKLKPKITCSWSIHFRQLIYPTPLLDSYAMSCSCHYYRYIILMLDLRLVSFAATEIPPQRSAHIILFLHHLSSGQSAPSIVPVSLSLSETTPHFAPTSC